MILFSCEHATAAMTDHLEGALPWPKRLAMRVHLILCAGCRAFLKGLRAVPILAREAFREPETPPAIGCASLEAVLGRIRAGEGRGPALHPDAAQWAELEDGRADLASRLLLEAHLGACAACRAAHPALPAHGPSKTGTDEPPLPEGLKAQLPPAAAWTWHRRGLNGCRSARLWSDAATSLWLTFVPPGCRFPDHRHADLETALILDGWVRDGLELAGPGDFIHRAPGSHHAPETTGAEGCWVLARVGPGGVRFSGWRRFLG